MTPWMWILWTVVALVVIFISSAVAAAIYEGIRDSLKPKPCERCGHTPGQPVGHWKKPA